VTDGNAAPRQLGLGGLMLAMAIFVVVGSPLVYLIWGVANDVLTGHVSVPRLLLAIPALFVFLIVLNFLARSIRRWDASLG